MRLKNKRRWSRGELSRTLVLYCVRVMTITLFWAGALKTAGAVFGWVVELTDVLTFAGGTFGGELLLLAFKRIFAKPNDNENGGTYG